MTCQYKKLYNCNKCEYGFLVEGYYYDCKLRLEKEAIEQEYIEHFWILEQELMEKKDEQK